eukprot:9873292-Alexandrium_andersonii.AAC.1
MPRVAPAPAGALREVLAVEGALLVVVPVTLAAALRARGLPLEAADPGLATTAVRPGRGPRRPPLGVVAPRELGGL